MAIRSRVIKIVDNAFEEAEPSGKVAVLALEVERLVVIPRQLLDDVRYLVARSRDEDFDFNDARISILAIRRSLEQMDQDK